MSVDKKHYPLATAGGVAIPLDAIRPHSLLLVEASASVGSSSYDIPEGVELMHVLATTSCILTFSAAAIAGIGALVKDVLRVDTLLIPTGVLILIATPVGMPFFSVRAIATDGLVYAQFLETWTGLASSSQLTRR